ncbi:N-acetyl sugar amidotransferase [Laribacter hongkongensis]|uniref:N-acetyl sugar amidotransferase n=1 Tax=Laribacter hongkongensis TaxID=168471 RepID=UPI001EFECC3C|nr:N-acetyl sugar amidotransferase [Laribacter hongkongensis]MCG8995502.1 N-acetyl sugar amidotransferase [Laribacter hongkongensis]MCG9010319.1 N-acetyl sugar amidotransferase [Laribacter hongkongensis]MCG9046213.1 N-acetyl sugar amidotransferase [Laribacter hongkongensis]MCG9051754.1 N-acetyl sugar amidotransferase [Laribacter hongkongensis]MCG9073785.1 N-acetyl sugar amidotransferase [Laribacter hongkongensis]
MKYCTHCLQTDTRPNTRFTEEGLCPACDYFGRLANVDWQERFDILQDLLVKFPRKSGQQFDCIIGVSGGKDSTRQALWVRDKLKLRPLLACLTYPPEQVTQRGVENISNLIELGFDVVIAAPAPGTWKRLMRESFDRFTNWARSTELALFSSVPQLAIRYGIPLILWGENPGLQLGDLKTLGCTGYDGNNLRNMNTLSGGALDWMLETGLLMHELIPYQYPSPQEFDQHGLQIVYLGWFLGDWSLANNGMYSASNGLQIREDTVASTGDLWGVTSLDEDWVTLNQMIKYYKFGFGRVTDYVNEEIRLGRMSRQRAIELVEQYDDACSDEYIESFCRYIEIDKQAFWNKVHGSLNRDLFNLDSSGKITRKFEVGVGL